MTEPRASSSTARRAATVCGIGALFIIAFVVLKVAAQALLLAFAGVLFGTSLRGLAAWLATKLRWKIRWTLLLCGLVLLGLTVATVFIIVPQVADQFTALSDRLTLAYEELREKAMRSEVGQRLLGGGSSVDNPAQYLGRAAGVLASIAGAIGSGLFVLFVALYIAASPEVYRRGVLQLVSPPRRARMASVLDALARTLRRWMLGRIVSMTAVGVTTTVGLAIMGIPLSMTLGLLAGILGFVPNLGPIASAIPALLIAATIDVPHVAYVLALYVAVNILDGYVLTPLIEKRSVATPAALVIVAQLVFGAIWGILGLTLATPLLACLLVLIRMLYVEDVLEQRPQAAN